MSCSPTGAPVLTTPKIQHPIMVSVTSVTAPHLASTTTRKAVTAIMRLENAPPATNTDFTRKGNFNQIGLIRLEETLQILEIFVGQIFQIFIDGLHFVNR